MERVPATGEGEIPRSVRIGCGAVLLVTFGILGLAVLEDLPGWLARSATPAPEGLVLQVVLPEMGSPFHEIEVLAVERNGPAIAILDGVGRSTPPRVTVVRYPEGEVLERLDEPDARQLEDLRAGAWAPGTFDLDGDGQADEPSYDYGGWVYVRSGVEGRVLWLSHDPLEYEFSARLTPLADLDGDGCSELAVLHPRMDRSDYDIHPIEAILGVHSWLSVVSGARATR